MAQDFLSVITPNTDLTVADFDGRGPGTSTDLATGDIRRRYNFGARFSELAKAQDPFFRLLSKVSKKPTDDPQFKFSEKRGSYHKRYAYVIGFVNNTDSDVFNDMSLVAYNNGGTPVADDILKVYMATDYQNKGNVQNVFGNTANKFDVGVTDTRPGFFLPGQVIKIPTMTDGGADGSSWGNSYLLMRITQVDDSLSLDGKECVRVIGKVVRASDSGSAAYAGWISNDFSPGGSEGNEAVSDQSLAGDDTTVALEKARSYVVGSAHSEGSGYPETWKDQPYSSNHGLTQIWKTAMAMSNTARATQLKYEQNEWARIWKEKLIEHKWDIETSLLFGSQLEGSDGVHYTQGAVDYITNFGNQFSLPIATKSADDFLDDLSNYVDPRYNSATGTVFFCNTVVYNWLHKLSGYFRNNVELSSNFNSDIQMAGKKNVFGIDITTIRTPYGDMNVARNIHLDGTNVKMLGINMKYCYWRPLVGNGINRDTSVYVGVQTLENSGVDRRVDLILTEGGMEWSMPECHAIWT